MDFRSISSCQVSLALAAVQFQGWQDALCAFMISDLLCAQAVPKVQRRGRIEHENEDENDSPSTTRLTS
ncbi:hypothetical protein [Prosthecobacter sp.]|uniref:hypothetical protein n=1 Tax=Prosthecobacter sp. TaxID=1965333 RepID=UPI00248951DE|nr:hypothetical protein [Prosthecobacter sp.]MDI1313160.1 hypothetical protein [Prosthecobacter sp.]